MFYMSQKLFDLTIAVLFLPLLFTVSCSAQQTDEQALQSLRQMTQDGKPPAEQFVANIETRFAGKKTGTLAKLLRAKIRFDAGDLAGAAALLNTNVFNTTTGVADHALWLRGRALQGIGNHAEAMKVFSELLTGHPESVRARDAKLLWATSAVAAGRASEVPAFLAELNDKKDADALLLTAKAYETQGSQQDAIKFYRRTFFYTSGSAAADEASKKLLTFAPSLRPQTDDEQLALADSLFRSKKYYEAALAYRDLTQGFPNVVTNAIRLRQVASLAGSGKPLDAQIIHNLLPASSPEREESYRHLVLSFAKAKMWPQARTTADEMRQKFPNGPLVPKTLMDAGIAARPLIASDGTYAHMLFRSGALGTVRLFYTRARLS